MDKYIHKKTGKEYELLSTDFKIKDFPTFKINVENKGFFDVIDKEDSLQWREGFYLYKALYDCPDGPYFARPKCDFLENFEQIK